MGKVLVEVALSPGEWLEGLPVGGEEMCSRKDRENGLGIMLSTR